MKPLLKGLIIELVLLVTVFIAVWMIAFWLTGAYLIQNPSIDINLHDTYFVISRQTIVGEPFLALVTIIYLIKEGIRGYRRKLQNFIMIISNFLFIMQLTTLFAVIGILENGEWDIAPSIAALPNEKTLLPYLNFFYRIEHIMFITFAVFLLILVINSILTGKNWKSARYETKA